MNCDGLREDFELIDKVGMYIQQNNGNFEKNRKTIRDSIIDLFKAEKAGHGIGDKSRRVIYCVEKVTNEIIYIKRPALLNKGFDFEIHTKSKQFNGRIKSRPRHSDIFDLLTQLKSENNKIFDDVQKIIDELYYCNEKNISVIRYKINNIEIETILKVIKWLFIEQDITYWSFSGREMLHKGLKNV